MEAHLHGFSGPLRGQDNAAPRIAALESQVKALTEERDQARREHADAQHRYTVAMHDISTACAGTAARSACEVVELWRKERDAQAEAVRLLGREVATWAKDRAVGPNWLEDEVSLQVLANPIARAAVKGVAQ